MAATQTQQAERPAADQTASGPIAKAEPTPPVITTAEEYQRSVSRWRGRFHLLTPVVAFSGIAPQHGLIAAQVQIDNNPDNGEVYVDPLFCKRGNKDPLDDEVAIAKAGLRKLALAGGWNLSAEPLHVKQHYWMMRGRNRFQGLDGAVQELSAIVEYDLREGSELIRNFTAKQKAAQRAHGLRHADARAMNAACREFGIRQKYTRRELQKPFVVLRMMFLPDPNNEQQMRFFMERALQGTTTLYPQTASLPPHVPVTSLDEEPQAVGAGTTFEQIPPADTEPRPPAIPDGMVLIKDVKVEQKKRRDGSGTFPKWHVTDSNGEEHVTIDKKIGETLERWDRRRPLEIVSAENGYNELEIEQVIPGPDPNQPSLLTPDAL